MTPCQTAQTHPLGTQPAGGMGGWVSTGAASSEGPGKAECPAAHAGGPPGDNEEARVGRVINVQGHGGKNTTTPSGAASKPG